MHRMLIKTGIALLVLLFLTGCAGLEQEEKKEFTYETMEFENTKPSLNQAILATNAAESGNLNSLPFVSIDPAADMVVDKISHAAAFEEVFLHIGIYSSNPDQSTTLGYFSETRDIYGRIDCRKVDMIYRTKQPDKAQTEKIKNWLLEQNKSSHSASKGISKEELRGFQKEKGLTRDGIFGPNTAAVLAGESSIIHVRRLHSRIIYPENPNHMLFILPYSTFNREKDNLPHGFKSWMTISKMGLSKDEFKSQAQTGERFVLFLYFFDRVHPARGISLHFADRAKSRDNSGASEKHYAKPGTWPVMLKTFRIEDNLSDDLYLNIFISRNRFTSYCVGSHKLL